MFLFSLLFVGRVAIADDVTIGTFVENGTKRFDYVMLYVVGNTTIEGVPLRIQFDQFLNPNNNFRRIWINAGNFNLIKSKSLTASFSPGVILTSDKRFFLGGTLCLDYKPLNLSVVYKPAAGNKHDRHLLFTTVQLTKEWGIEHYYYTEKGYSPDSYIGPVFTKGSVYMWAGASTNRPGAWSVNTEIKIKL